MATMETALAALREHFGFEDFREGQREVIDAVLAGRDTVVVMPTGGGKSLCYQLPAMIKDGATVVVSPLIALMKDQVDALHARNLPATFINSSIDFEEQRARLQAVRRGQYKLVYVAPERFRSQHFVEVLQSARVALFAIDEAHCISQWGHDFRPDYLRLKEVIERVGRPQVIALTATATPHVRSDIIEQLGLHEPHAIVSGFDRPNLSINVVQTQKETEKIGHIKALAARKGSGIIYTSTRKAVEQVAAKLGAAGLAVVAYHAGMTDEERNEAQENFMTGRTQMIVATNAFGMGIDKPDIRFVAHYHMPGSIEAYYQEIGRAGRDGLPSTCTLLFNYADKRTHDFFIEGSYPPPDIIARVYQALVGTNQKRIELSTKEIAQRAGVRNEMSVQSALIILEKAGHIERGANSENRAAVRLRMNPQQAREKIEARRSTQMRQVLWGLLGGYNVNERADTELDFGEFAETVGLDSQAVRRAVSSLTEAGIITFQAARRTRGVLLLDERPVRQLRIQPAEIARRAALEQRKVREMINFCYTDRCFRAHILDYFNDRHHAAICGTCGNCVAQENRGTLQTPRVPSLEPPTQLDEFVMEHRPFALDLEHELSEATRLRHAQEAAEARHDSSNNVTNVTEARELTDEEKLHVRKVLACAARMNGRFGKNLLAGTLRGSRSGKVVESGLDQLSTHGILSDLSQGEVIAYIDALVAARCLTIKGGAYPTVSLSALGGEVMRERAEIKLVLSVAAAPTVRAPHQSPQLHKPNSMQNGAGK
ncbi:MAG: RecQ family ATP-dependent DNA helicase, partial [Pyrinomonadaceae bacterium]|nr:RecQ family ATP-dependent DNA helicase [Pyrinomonadaceae bacterium]